MDNETVNLKFEFNGDLHAIDLANDSEETLESLFSSLRENYELDKSAGFIALSPIDNKRIEKTDTKLIDLWKVSQNKDTAINYDLVIFTSHINSRIVSNSNQKDEIKGKDQSVSQIRIQPSGTISQEIASQQSSRVYNLANDCFVIHTTWLPIIKRGLQPAFTTQLCFTLLGVSLGTALPLGITLYTNQLSGPVKGVYAGVFWSTLGFFAILLILTMLMEKNRKELLNTILIELDDLDIQKTANK